MVYGIAAEGEEEFITLYNTEGDNHNKYVVFIDPLVGSPNIVVKASVVTKGIPEVEPTELHHREALFYGNRKMVGKLQGFIN